MSGAVQYRDDGAVRMAGRLCAALDLAPSPVAVVDLDGRCLAVNRTLARRAGAGPSGLASSALLLPRTVARFAAALSDLALGPAAAEGPVPLLPGPAWRVYLRPFAPDGVVIGAVVVLEHPSAAGRSDAEATERRLSLLVDGGGGLRRGRLDLTSEIRKRRPEERFDEEASGVHPDADAAAPLVLVCEDEARLGALTVSLLEAHGYRSVAVPTDGEALAWLERAEPRVDVLLADLRLRGSSALVLVRAIEARGLPVPVVITSGVALEDLPVELRTHSSVVGFLPKPYTSAEAVRAIESALLRQHAGLTRGGIGR